MLLACHRLSVPDSLESSIISNSHLDGRALEPPTCVARCSEAVIVSGRLRKLSVVTFCCRRARVTRFRRYGARRENVMRLRRQTYPPMSA
jgi:hypothetical protein